jgi:hypothetical protein
MRDLCVIYDLCINIAEVGYASEDYEENSLPTEQTDNYLR